MYKPGSLLDVPVDLRSLSSQKARPLLELQIWQKMMSGMNEKFPSPHESRSLSRGIHYSCTMNYTF